MQPLKRRQPFVVASILVLGLTALAGCGEDGDSTGPTPPASFAGTWTVVETASGEGIPEVMLQYDVTIAVNGSSVDVTIEGSTWSGTLNGNTLTLTDVVVPTVCTEGDRTLTTLSWTLGSDGTISGTADWCCPSPPLACGFPGSSTFTATRKSP